MADARTWSGDLRPLADLLSREAEAAETRRAWRTLEDGTLVAVLLAPGAPRVLRLARENAAPGWEADLLRLAARLGRGDWPREVEVDGRAVALRFTEPEAMGTVPCACGCGRAASRETGTFVGFAPACAEARRVRMGWRPLDADAPPACTRCGRELDSAARLFGGRLCSACGVREKAGAGAGGGR